MKNLLDTRQTNGAPPPRRDTAKLAMFYVAALLFGALSVPQIMLALQFPAYAADIARVASTSMMIAVFFLGFAMGVGLR